MLTPMTASRNLARAVLGLALAVSLAGLAQAADYVVISSTDPALSRGKALDAGARVALAPGRSLTVMHASGNVLTLKGSAAGVVLPKRSVSPADADRMNVLKVMVSPKASQRATSGFGRTRSGVCPLPESLTTLDQIVAAHSANCAAAAEAALDAYVAGRAE